MTLREQLIQVSDAYGDALRIGRQRTSTIVLNRGATLDGLATGKIDITTSTFERAMIWFSQNWPDDLEWPPTVPRPFAAKILEIAK